MVATFGAGSCGMGLALPLNRSGVTKIGTDDDGSQAMEQGVQSGSVILEVAGISIQLREYAAVKQLLIGAERPMTVVLARPAYTYCESER